MFINQAKNYELQNLSNIDLKRDLSTFERWINTSIFKKNDSKNTSKIRSRLDFLWLLSKKSIRSSGKTVKTRVFLLHNCKHNIYFLFGALQMFELTRNYESTEGRETVKEVYKVRKKKCRTSRRLQNKTYGGGGGVAFQKGQRDFKFS